MPWVLFTGSFDWVPPLAPMTAVAYRCGMRLLVTTPCAQAAIAAGKAEPSSRPQELASDRRS